MPFNLGNLGFGQVAIVVLLGLVVIAVRYMGWRERRIAALWDVIKGHREVVKDYPNDHDAQNLASEKAERASKEIRRLEQGGGFLGKAPAILAAVIGLSVAWWGTSSGSSTTTLTGAALVLIALLLFLTS